MDCLKISFPEQGPNESPEWDAHLARSSGRNWIAPNMTTGLERCTSHISPSGIYEIEVGVTYLTQSDMLVHANLFLPTEPGKTNLVASNRGPTNRALGNFADAAYFSQEND